MVDFDAIDDRFRGQVCFSYPQQMDAAMAQQLSQLGPDQRNSGITIGNEFANKIVVKCP